MGHRCGYIFGMSRSKRPSVYACGLRRGGKMYQDHPADYGGSGTRRRLIRGYELISILVRKMRLR